MKKTCLLVLSGALILGLAACSKTPTDPSTDTTPTQSSSVTPSSEEPSSEEPTPSSEEPSSEEPAPTSSEEPSSEEPTPSSEEPAPSSEEPVPSSEEPTPSSSEEPVTYAITVDENTDSRIDVSVPSFAQEGEKVEVSLTYDASAITVSQIWYNGFQAGYDGAAYYFYMPAEEVTIYVFATDVVTYYDISNGNSDAVSLAVSESAAAGETVYFSYSILPGYVQNGSPRVVLDPIGFEEETVEVEKASDNVWSFVMPEQDVLIKVPTSYGVYGVTESDEDGVIYTIKGASDSSNVTNGYAAYKDTITVTLTSTAYKKGVGIKVPELYGEEVLTPADGEKTVTFTMPHFDVTVIGVSEDYIRPFSIVNSDHITIATYKKDADGAYVLNETGGAVYGDTVYVKATSTDDSVYSVDAIKFVYYGESNWGGQASSTSSIDVSSSINDDGYYYFTMPKVYDGTEATLTVTEQDLTKYLGKSFVGSYMNAELYNDCTGWRSQKVAVSSSGKFTYGSSTYDIESLDEETKTATLSNDGAFQYGGNWIIGRYNFGSSSIFSTDMSLSIKKQADADEDSLYTIHYQFIGSAKNYAAAEVYRDGILYDSLFLDIKNETAYLEGVTFEKLDSTEYVDDTLASYNVLVDGTTIAKVRTTSTTGGYENRAVVDEVYGSYTLSGETEATLVLDGQGGATYNGSTGTYTYEGTTVTLTVGKSVYTIALDLTAGTYSVTSSEEYQPINGLDQNTYSGTFEDTWDESHTLIVSFDGTTCTVAIPQYSGSSTYYLGGITDSTKLADQTYELDTDNMTVTCSYYQSSTSSTLSTISFTVSSDYKTLTCTSDATSFYATSGATLTLSE